MPENFYQIINSKDLKTIVKEEELKGYLI